ncbi:MULTISPECIES: hypothetical protein [unclassified Nostoc]|uniref:hypothetical protein n=1 Tax=unclassified Nostoc TaxID=2593658 RepID=UPI002AD23D1E|nr:hypothetical protein [Nostoc sp. ChiQUE02]MDZ8235259.1 hypothetical protein [Nostoc sp. ChiQUE02]
MSDQIIMSDLLVELSTEEQQLLSGGKEYPIEELEGFVIYGDKKRPVKLKGTIDLPKPKK